MLNLAFLVLVWYSSEETATAIGQLCTQISLSTVILTIWFVYCYAMGLTRIFLGYFMILCFSSCSTQLAPSNVWFPSVSLDTWGYWVKPTLELCSTELFTVSLLVNTSLVDKRLLLWIMTLLLWGHKLGVCQWICVRATQYKGFVWECLWVVLVEAEICFWNVVQGNLYTAFLGMVNARKFVSGNVVPGNLHHLLVGW